MSVIKKILAAECFDPGAEVCFVVVLECANESAIRDCRTVFSDLDGEIVVEAGVGLFLFKGHVGLDPDPVLLCLNILLDEVQDGVTLIETKFINARHEKTTNHSFVFKEDGEPDRRTIILSPSHAFGSGDHPSTCLALEFLEEEVDSLYGDVLDVGCGTGVLSFAAARLGAGRVLGVDIDPEGLRGARLNVTLNQLSDRVEFSSQPLTMLTGEFPLILANLTCSVLRFLLADFSLLASPTGLLIVSGLQGRQGDEAEAFLVDFGWQVQGRKSLGKWQALRAVRDNADTTPSCY